MTLKEKKADSLDNFKIFETNQFLKDLEQDFSDQQAPLDKKNYLTGQERIRKKLASYAYPQLKQNPYFGKNIKKLKGYLPETWRYRIGPCRFFYEIDDQKKIISMIAADNRQSAY